MIDKASEATLSVVPDRHNSVTNSRDSRRGVAATGEWSPRISIVVPALNEEKLIERTLRCFPSETRERLGIEVIVSDGGSSDRTIEIARELVDHVVVHDEPRRQTIAGLPMRFSASPRPTVVVVLPSPAAVGVIAVIRMSFALGRVVSVFR